MTNPRAEAADPFEEEGQASTESGLPGKRITGDPQDDMAVPLDRPTAATEYGTTAREQHAREPLDRKLARELPDPGEGGLTGEEYAADQPYPESNDEKAGRLVAPDEGVRSDAEPDAVARSVGTDHGGFTAEERAMHLEPE